MNIIIYSPQQIIEANCPEGQRLSDLLGHNGLHLDMRCGGRNRCHRCQIVLTRGIFEVNGQPYDCANGELAVNSCSTLVLTGPAAIRVPAMSLHQLSAQISLDFTVMPDLSNPEPDLALAVDLGTTTVAAVLLDNGKILGRAGIANPQFRFGDNVSSRISYAGHGKAELQMLQHLIISAVCDLANELTNHRPETIKRLAVAGNTVMTHLFFGYDPSSIGVMPFTPLYHIIPLMRAYDLPLCIDPEAPVLAAPCISGYVGGDIVAGLETVGFGQHRYELFIDIGTNCEIVLKAGDRLVCAAAAAGPAFEGAGLSCGGRAALGAIDHIEIRADGAIDFHVIGEVAPLSICGSAMIDFLATAHCRGWLNDFGRFDLDLLQKADRLRSEGNLHFCRITENLAVSEADIEQLLKAKAAVMAGITALLSECQVAPEQLQKIYLAGGFAKFLNLDRAIAIKMLPDLKRNVYLLCGNTSLAGAAALANQPKHLAQYSRRLEGFTEIPLNTIGSFEMTYIDSLLL